MKTDQQIANDIIVETGLTCMVSMIHEFHEKLDISPRCDLVETSEDDKDANRLLSETAKVLSEFACILMDVFVVSKDYRLLRAHLHVEETAELITALEHRDEVGVLDALADILYITGGTADVYDLPIGPAFIEVHGSNMTKEKQPHDVGKDRIRDKGPRYAPPNLGIVLTEYRTYQSTEESDEL